MNSDTGIVSFSFKLKNWNSLSHNIESKYPDGDLLLRKRRYSFWSKFLEGVKPEFIKGKTPMQLVGVAGESLKQGKQDKNKLIEEIKIKNRKKKFNIDNINLLHKTIEQQKEDESLNYNLLKSKNMIIKDMNNRANGFVLVPHYSLPKNIRINSAKKSQNFNNNIFW